MRRVAFLVTALAAAALCGPVHAQLIGTRGMISILGPLEHQVVAHPTFDEVNAAWPAEARARGQGGSAAIHCLAALDGTLTDCGVMLEREHAGFGQALLSLAPKVRVKPAVNGVREGRADVVITAAWPLPDTPVDWQVKPKAGDFSTSYTYAAYKSPVPGTAVMNCLVAKLGAVHDCMVVYQDPPGKGFGTMLLRFQGFLALKPAQFDGKPIATGVNFAMKFGVPAQDAAGKPRPPAETRP